MKSSGILDLVVSFSGGFTWLSRDGRLIEGRVSASLLRALLVCIGVIRQVVLCVVAFVYKDAVF